MIQTFVQLALRLAALRNNKIALARSNPKAARLLSQPSD